MPLGMWTYHLFGRTVILDKVCFVNEPKEVASGKQSGFGPLSNLILLSFCCVEQYPWIFQIHDIIPCILSQNSVTTLCNTETRLTEDLDVVGLVPRHLVSDLAHVLAGIAGAHVADAEVEAVLQRKARVSGHLELICRQDLAATPPQDHVRPCKKKHVLNLTNTARIIYYCKLISHNSGGVYMLNV